MADIAERHAKRMDEARRLDRQLKKRDYALWATVNAYRRALRDVTHNAPIIDPARQESALAPCPICGKRTAVLSWGDLEAGSTVQIYCDNEDCVAREIDITIRRGPGYRGMRIDWP